MKRRRYTDEQLKALAAVFDIDTGGAFDPITDEYIAAKTKEIFTDDWRDALAQRLTATLEGKGAT